MKQIQYCIVFDTPQVIDGSVIKVVGPFESLNDVVEYAKLPTTLKVTGSIETILVEKE